LAKASGGSLAFRNFASSANAKDHPTCFSLEPSLLTVGEHQDSFQTRFCAPKDDKDHPSMFVNEQQETGGSSLAKAAGGSVGFRNFAACISANVKDHPTCFSLEPSALTFAAHPDSLKKRANVATDDRNVKDRSSMLASGHESGELSVSKTSSASLEFRDTPKRSPQQSGPESLLNHRREQKQCCVARQSCAMQQDTKAPVMMTKDPLGRMTNDRVTSSVIHDSRFHSKKQLSEGTERACILWCPLFERNPD